MNKVFTKIVKFIKLALAYIPTSLPMGMIAFDRWAESVIALTGLPDNDSTRFALATTIMHMSADKARVPKIRFVNMLCKSASNQIAHAIMQELKNKQLEKAAAEQAAMQQAEATAAKPEGNEQQAG